MKLGKVQKDTTDISRVVIDCSKWLDQAETITTVGNPSIVTDYTTGAVPQGDGEVLYPPDSTPLTVAAPTIAGTNVTLMLHVGTPTLSYWVEFLVTGGSGRAKTLELYVECNALTPTPSLVNGIYPPVSVLMLPDAPPIDPFRLWNNGNIVAVTQDGTRTTPTFNEITITDSANIVGYVSIDDFDRWTVDLVTAAEAAAAAPVQTVAGRTGYITLSHNDITDWNTAAPAAAAVKSVATRTGDVVLSHGDITDWSSATQYFVTYDSLAVDGFAPLNSPHFTGNPTAPNPSVSDSSGAIATTAWLQALLQGRYAPLDSPAFINLPTGPTPPPIDNSTRLATTAYVRRAVAASTTGVSSVSGRTGDVILTHTDVTDWGTVTQPFLQWNVGSVTALSPSILLVNGTLTAAGFSSQHYLGNYNALTNTPSLGALGTGVGGGVNGNTWAVSVAGTVAVDGVGAVVVSDQIVNNGSLWIRLPASTAYGSMAVQNANNVAITNGNIAATITALGTLAIINAGNTLDIIPGGSGALLYTDQSGVVGHGWDGSSNLGMGGSFVAGSGFLVGQAGANGANWQVSATGASGAGWQVGAPAVTGTGFSISATGWTTGLSVFSVGANGMGYIDQYGAVGEYLDPSGNLTLAGTSVAGAGFSQSSAGWVSGPARFVVGTGGLAYIDQYGAIGEYLDPNGNFSIGGSIVGAGFTITAGGITGPGITQQTIFTTAANAAGGITGLLMVDIWGAVGLIVDPVKAPIPYVSTLPPTSYDTAYLQRRDNAALANSNANQGMQSPYAQKPSFGYNLWIVYGQSQSCGVNGSPALTLTQPTDALMLGPFGIASQGGVVGSGTIWVSPDNNFHPAIGTNQPVGLLHTGVIPNMGVVSLAGSGSAGTITQTGGSSVAWNTVFSINDYCGFTGWPAPNTALNNDTSPAPWNCIGTISGITANSMAFTIGPGITITPDAGASTVSVQQISHAGNGERFEIEGVTTFRRLSLDTKQMPADPSRQLVTVATGHGGEYIEQLRPQPSSRNWQAYITQSLTGQIDTVDTNAGRMTITGVTSIQGLDGTNYVNGVDYTVSGSNITWVSPRPNGRKYIANITFTNQNDFGIPVTAAQAFKATATGLGATSGVFLIAYWQGTSDGGSTTYAGYKASLAGLIADFEAQVVAGVFGQSRSPVYLIIPDSATNLSEPLGLINDPKGMCVAQADLDTALSPPIPTVYILGGTYVMPRSTLHLMGNGYRWLGALVGKVSHLIVDLGVNWKPLHMTQATYRGNQVLIDFYVPVPPIQIQPFFLLSGGATTIWPDWGFLVIDALGVVPITAVALNGAATVLLTLGRLISGSAIVRYADGLSHTGAGNICDSDPAVSDVPWVYSAGNGQWPIENVPGWNGKPFPLWNWCCNAAVPLISG